ncbi:MAG: capsule assembly Wzi family protein, partial [Longimicrobiales bacterium]|nr:capsule assembly Wzi family protein [Longimicrobiales bacterium]
AQRRAGTVGRRAELIGAAASKDRVVRPAGALARENGDVRAGVGWWDGDRLDLRLGFAWRDDQRGRNAAFDDTWAGVRLGNWEVHASTRNEWWGPGWDGALVLSDNARPIPRVGIRRITPHEIDVPVLRWLGPWSVSFSAGRLEGDREVENPLLLLMRVGIAPARGLEFGFSRGIQICGEGRECNLDRFARALGGVADLDNTSDKEDDPSNQLASLDGRWSGRFGSATSWAVYAELMGEDQGALLLKVVSALAGATIEGGLPAFDAGWRLRFEAADTRGGSVFGIDDPQFGATFNHSVYRDGWSFKGRTLAHSIDSDSRLYTGEAMIMGASGRSYRLAFRNVLLNDPALGRHKVTDTRETINLIEMGVESPVPGGAIRTELIWQDDQPNSPGVQDGAVRVEIGWRIRR